MDANSSFHTPATSADSAEKIEEMIKELQLGNGEDDVFELNIDPFAGPGAVLPPFPEWDFPPSPPPPLLQYSSSSSLVGSSQLCPMLVNSDPPVPAPTRDLKRKGRAEDDPEKQAKTKRKATKLLGMSRQQNMSQKFEALRELTPGCSKKTNKATLLDCIIETLQEQEKEEKMRQQNLPHQAQQQQQQPPAMPSPMPPRPQQQQQQQVAQQQMANFNLVNPHTYHQMLCNLHNANSPNYVMYYAPYPFPARHYAPYPFPARPHQAPPQQQQQPPPMP